MAIECSLLAAYRRAYGSSRSPWSKGRRPPGTVLHSSHKPGELSQCIKHDDSTIQIIPVLLSLSAYGLQYCIRLCNWIVSVFPWISGIWGTVVCDAVCTPFMPGVRHCSLYTSREGGRLRPAPTTLNALSCAWSIKKCPIQWLYQPKF